jgi:hypothetical protein
MIDHVRGELTRLVRSLGVEAPIEFVNIPDRLSEVSLDCVGDGVLVKSIRFNVDGIINEYNEYLGGVGVPLGEFLMYMVEHEVDHIRMTEAVARDLGCTLMRSPIISNIIAGLEDVAIDLKLAIKYPWVRGYICGHPIKPTLPPNKIRELQQTRRLRTIPNNTNNHKTRSNKKHNKHNKTKNYVQGRYVLNRYP